MPSSDLDHPWPHSLLVDLRHNLGLNDLEFHERLESTNTRALERLRAGEWESPTLILAHQQTRGRGRGANRWWSTEGGLTFSVLIEPSSSALPNLPQWTLRAGLAVAEALDQVRANDPNRLDSTARASQPIGLKWPNDLWLNHRKLGGVLVETVAERRGVVIGIGLNINQRLDEAPDEVRVRATSLFEVDGETRSLPLVLRSVIRRLLSELQADAVPNDWVANGPELSQQPQENPWWERFRERCILTDQIVAVVQGSQRFAGRCQGIDSSGRLIVVSETERHEISSGTVESIG